MAFEDLEFIGTPAKPKTAVPELGVRIAPRAVGNKTGGRYRFISVMLGAKIASGIGLRHESHQVKVAFGIGPDAGKIRIMPDTQNGQFVARRDKQGCYRFSINAATADGLFALEFPPFTVDLLRPEKPPAGPPRVIFEASEQMLECD